MREALRLMEKVERQEAEKLGLLRQAWREGVDSGEADAVDFAALKREARASRRQAVSEVDAMPTRGVVTPVPGSSPGTHMTAERRRSIA